MAGRAARKLRALARGVLASSPRRAAAGMGPMTASGAVDGAVSHPAPSELDELRAEARAATRRGQHGAAVAMLDELAVREPARATNHYALACALERSGRLEEAAASYLAALTREARRATWHAKLGAVRQRLEDFSGAAAAFQAAVDRDPTSAQWHAKLGACRRKAGDLAGAAVAYQEAIFRDPTVANWHFWLGACRELSGDWAGATTALKRADELAAADGSVDLPSQRLQFRRRINLSLVPRPQYAYGLHRACELARSLGIERITAIEFGVAGGNGLVALEENAAELRTLSGVRIDVVGFDTGGGLYEPADVRDMPYFFAAGLYAIDEPALRERLGHARLVLGDAAETFPGLLTDLEGPIGVLSFDMDVYSATAGVLRHLGDGAADERFLPRFSVYFDDVSGFQGQDYNRFTGELLAIDEFNEENSQVKLAEDRTFRTLPVNRTWHHGTYTMHRFAHPEYDTYISPADARSLSLRDDR
jgi:tetratricopeptide (TPR) repeat protein